MRLGSTQHLPYISINPNTDFNHSLGKTFTGMGWFTLECQFIFYTSSTATAHTPVFGKLTLKSYTNVPFCVRGPSVATFSYQAFEVYKITLTCYFWYKVVQIHQAAKAGQSLKVVGLETSPNYRTLPMPSLNPRFDCHCFYAKTIIVVSWCVCTLNTNFEIIPQEYILCDNLIIIVLYNSDMVTINRTQTPITNWGALCPFKKYNHYNF